jgi:hypothetical protein
VQVRKEARLKISLAPFSHLYAMQKRNQFRNIALRYQNGEGDPPPTQYHFASVNQRSNPSNNTTLDRLLPKPTDVAKAIPDSSRYAGKSDEPFRSKYQVFLRACIITGLKESEQVLRLTVMEVGFLIGVALDYFQRSVITSVRTTDDAAGMIENHFLPDRVRAMNETAFNALSFDHVASIVPPENKCISLGSIFLETRKTGKSQAV